MVNPRLAAIGGIALAVAVALAATALGRIVPLAGAPVLAIVLGVVIRTALTPSRTVATGLAWCSKYVLQAAIVISGFGLSLLAIVTTGWRTLPVTIATIAVALLLAVVAGRALRVSGAVRQLIGMGTAICGASAIAAVASVIEPEESELALSIATIFLYNVIAVLLFPPLGHAMHLSQSAFGLWAGTAINDTSSVVAAGYVYGHEAGAYATIVKLTRATFILPLVAGIAFLRAREARRDGTAVNWRRIVPWFILWFLVAAVVNTLGAVPASWHAAIVTLATFFITIALAAIGLQTQVAKLIAAGPRPLALGLILWAAVAGTSLVVAQAIGL